MQAGFIGVITIIGWIRLYIYTLRILANQSHDKDRQSALVVVRY